MTKSMLLLVAIGCAQTANAQMKMPSLPATAPGASSLSVGNAAGVLQYCATNKLVSTTSADSVLSGLKAKPDVLSSKDFSAGKAGKLLSGGKTTSLDSLPAPMKTQACDLVLKQAKKFL
jgi:hypothetical protein